MHSSDYFLKYQAKAIKMLKNVSKPAVLIISYLVCVKIIDNLVLIHIIQKTYLIKSFFGMILENTLC